jgi:hypothetical protein
MNGKYLRRQKPAPPPGVVIPTERSDEGSAVAFLHVFFGNFRFADDPGVSRNRFANLAERDYLFVTLSETLLLIPRPKGQYRQVWSM